MTTWNKFDPRVPVASPWANWDPTMAPSQSGAPAPVFNLDENWLKGMGYNGQTQAIDQTKAPWEQISGATSPQLMDWLKSKGYNLQLSHTKSGTPGFSNKNVGRMVDAQGNQVGDAQHWGVGNDDAFLGAGLAGAGFAGAAAAGVGAGAAGGGASAGGGGSLAGTGLPGYAANPYAYGGTQVASAAGGIPEGSLAGSAGLSGASDPMSAYLATGASDGSTIGGMGGYAGAVGSGAGPEALSAAIPGSSTSWNWGNAAKSLLGPASSASNGQGQQGGFGAGLAGLFAGGLTGAYKPGNIDLLNNVNYGDAATAQGQSQRTNQTNSQGSLTYQQTGTDAQGHPTYTQNVGLNAPYQNNLNSALGNQGAALGNLNNYNKGLPDAYKGVPGLYGDAGTQAGLVKQQQDAMYDAQKRYLDPQYAMQGKALDTQLANQGVTYGSDAYNNAHTQFGSQMNQAYGTARDSAINSGNQYANQLFNQNLAAHQTGMADINNQGNNYLNQSGGALNGVVQNPSFAPAPGGTNYLGAAQLQGGANADVYNAQVGNTQNLTRGLTGLGQSIFGNPNAMKTIGDGLSGFGSWLTGGG